MSSPQSWLSSYAYARSLGVYLYKCCYHLASSDSTEKLRVVFDNDDDDDDDVEDEQGTCTTRCTVVVINDVIVSSTTGLLLLLLLLPLLLLPCRVIVTSRRSNRSLTAAGCWLTGGDLSRCNVALVTSHHPAGAQPGTEWPRDDVLAPWSSSLGGPTWRPGVMSRDTAGTWRGDVVMTSPAVWFSASTINTRSLNNADLSRSVSAKQRRLRMRCTRLAGQSSASSGKSTCNVTRDCCPQVGGLPTHAKIPRVHNRGNNTSKLFTDEVRYSLKCNQQRLQSNYTT